MAKQADIEALYDWVDYFHTLRLGDYADFTAAFFDGDFTKTLTEAQRDKHAWILAGLGFQPGQRILDIGSGWGNMLEAIRQRGGTAVGLTLSRAQVRYSVGRGLDAWLQDWKTVDPVLLGMFDGVVSIGAFEHFCSIEEYLAGQQDQIYQDFFRLCAAVLRPGGKVFLQTMIWGNLAPDPRTMSLTAPEGTPERILARITKFYPGSWLPTGLDQIVRDGQSQFTFLSHNNGRLDYIETLRRWNESNRNLLRPSKFGKALLGVARLIPRYLADPNFRIQIDSMRHSDQDTSFKKEIMSHERMFFQKTGVSWKPTPTG